MKHLLLALFSVAVIGANAQWSINVLSDTNQVITFDSTVSGVCEGIFLGAGFQPAPDSGKLDSDGWKVTGLSDGASSYGGTHTTGDFAKGQSTGGIFSGGVYGFQVATGNYAVGVQPTGDDFSPGTLTLRVINNTGSMVDSVYIAYDLIINNNEARGNYFNFAYSVNDSATFNAVTELNDTSVATSQGSSMWVTYAKEIALPINLDLGDTLYLNWSSDDVSGSGSRDEFALDNIQVTMNQTGGTVVGLTVLPIETITTNDVNGEPDSLGVECWIKGVVLGVDLDGNAGYSFTLWDSAGINVFSFDDVDSYTVTEGDSLLIWGEVDQFNGLTQFVPDSIVLVNDSNPIPTHTLISSLAEMHESEMVRVENYWVDFISGSNYTLTDGTNSVVMRVDTDTDVDENVSFAIGDTVCFAQGIGGQFDASSPYTEGYQFFPQRATDVDNSCGSIIPPPTPFYPIPVINNVDADGLPDSLGVYCWTSGIVLGVDIDGNAGLSFTIFDQEGINVFNFVDVDAYTVTEGDSIMVRGSIGFFNGLTEIVPDSIVVTNTNGTLPMPMIVNAPSEITESAPIRVIQVMVVDTAQWPTTFSSNVDLVTCHGDTIVMRIDTDTDIEENIPQAPSGWFNVTGIGGQFDGSLPHLEGYQLFPMRATDIDTSGMFSAPSLVINEVMTNNQGAHLDQAGDSDSWFEIRNLSGADVNLGGLYVSTDNANPTMFQFPWNNMELITASGYKVIWMDGEVTEGPDHAGITLSASEGYLSITSYDGCTQVSSISIPALDSNESFGIWPETGDSLVVFPAGQSTPNAMNMLDTNTTDIAVIDHTQNRVMVYPNPAAGNEVVKFTRPISFALVDAAGRVLMRRNQATELNVAGLSHGLYYVHTNNGEVLALVVQ